LSELRAFGVDADAQKFTIEVLTNWKRAAQDHAFRELVAPDARASDEDVARVGLIIASDNARTADARLDSLFERIYAAASTDLFALKRTPIWSGSSVELTLRMYDDSTSSSFTISKLPIAVEIAPEVVIVAPPGTGKTTTLLQLAAQMLDANSFVPLYFRLADWSGSSTSSGSGRGGGSPRPECFVSEDTKRAAGCEMALDVECVLDGGVNRQEPLG
jgi:hypothetical protein